MQQETRVSYPDTPDQALTIRLIRAWHRDDIPEPSMSASSGPKAYIKNYIYEVFQENPEIHAVLMVRAHGPPFLLMRRKRCYFDMTAREVVIHGAILPEG